MASSPFAGLRRGGRGRLDPADRELVFCHVCSHEWPREDRESIQCPSCNSEATEIIEPGNDPRDIPDLPFPPFPFPRRFHDHMHTHESDSDPEEADIERHATTGPGNTFVHRTIYGSPARPRRGGGRDPDRLGMGGPDDIMMRFHEMILQMQMGAPRPVPSNGQANEVPFPGRPIFSSTTFSGPRIHVTTYRTGPEIGGVGSPGGPPNFQRLFSDLMGDPLTRPGEGPDRQPGGGIGPPQGGPIGFAAILEHILGVTTNPQSAVRGDAVYTQEALDHIISTLMEAHPQSNAAPPASQTAIESLEKKKLTDEMIGPEGKAECTICIDEMHRGDDATVLPCSHWFHEDCVTLWLKEHNTCPICRRPIESRSERRERRTTESSNNADQAHTEQFQSAAGPSSSEFRLPNQRSPLGGFREMHFSNMGDQGPRSPTISYSISGWGRQGSEGHDRNTPASLRNSSFLGTYNDGNSASSSTAPEPPGRPTFADFPFMRDDAREERQQEQRARARDEWQREEQRERDQTSGTNSNRRSPLSIFDSSTSSSTRRDNSGHGRDAGGNNGEGQRSSSSGSSGHNPFSWLRGHFGSGRNSGSGSSSGGGGGNGNSDRDRERRWRS